MLWMGLIMSEPWATSSEYGFMDRYSAHLMSLPAGHGSASNLNAESELHVERGPGAREITEYLGWQVS